MQVETVDYRAADAARVLTARFAIRVSRCLPTIRSRRSGSRMSIRAWGDFFAGEAKFDFAVTPPAHDGYFAFRSGKRQGSPVKDLKEFYPCLSGVPASRRHHRPDP